MTYEEAVQKLRPVLGLIGCRFIHSKKNRDIYQLGYMDLAVFIDGLMKLLNQDDPRWHGIAWMCEIIQKWGTTMTTPNNSKMTQEEYGNLGMERFSGRAVTHKECKGEGCPLCDNLGKMFTTPVPMPDGKIDQMVRLVLDKLQNPK